MEHNNSLNLDPRLARLLCYVLGWITGLIFYFVEKEDPNIRFHAMQSIVTFGAITILVIGLSIISFIFMIAFGFIGLLMPLVSGLFGVINMVIGIATLVIWILCMVKAYQEEDFKLPVAGDTAEKFTR